MTSRREQLATALQATHLLPLLRRVPGWRGVLVLNFHRVGDREACVVDRGVFSGTAESLDAQLALLKRETEIVLPADLAAIRDRPGRYAMLTFDDGYRDNYEIAFPILRSHGVRAAFFPCTSFIDAPRLAWWDEIAWMVRTSPRRGLPANPWLGQALDFDAPGREGAIRRLLGRYKALPADQAAEFLAFLAEATGSGRATSDAAGLWMTWDMLREMHAAGMEIGGHTVNHPVLARLRPQEQRAEIAGCRERLTAELGMAPRSFAYPVGSRDAFDATTRAILQEEGFEAAFAFFGGYARFGDRAWDPYSIPRVPASHDAGPTVTRALLALPQLVAASVPRRARPAAALPPVS